MRRKTAASCSKLLNNAAFSLLARARQLAELDRVVKQLLPESLLPHCKVINQKREILVLGATSSAWASRLRFVAPTLLKQLKNHLPTEISSIQIRTLPVESEPPTRKVEQPQISLATATLLARTADDIDHDGLREALYRLAANSNEN